MCYGFGIAVAANTRTLQTTFTSYIQNGHGGRLQETVLRRCSLPGYSVCVSAPLRPTLSLYIIVSRRHHLFLLILLSYAAMEGHGWQSAIVPQVMECLRLHFNVSGEVCGVHARPEQHFQLSPSSLTVLLCQCFASPLNVHLPQFCSAFPDTDTPFGSAGSFFDFVPSEGSFEVCPCVN